MSAGAAVGTTASLQSDPSVIASTGSSQAVNPRLTRPAVLGRSRRIIQQVVICTAAHFAGSGQTDSPMNDGARSRALQIRPSGTLTGVQTHAHLEVDTVAL